MKKNLSYPLLLFTVAITASCQKTDPAQERPTQGGNIVCEVYSEDTKGAVCADDSLKNNGFYLTAYLDEDYFKEGDKTTPTGKKGAYIGSLSSPKLVSFSGSSWSISGTPKWVAKDSTRFWCWYPDTLSKGTRKFFTESDYTGKDTLSFIYKMPSGGQKTSESPARACDASNQEDLLFAYNCRYHSGSGSDETVSLKLSHALSQINFIVYPLKSNMQASGDGSLRDDYQIIDISLQEVKDSAMCTIQGRPDGSTPNTSFSWDDHNGKETFTQYYGADFSSASSKAVPDGWTYKDYSSKAHYYCNNCFFIIPQDIEDATLSVKFKKDATEVTKLAKLNGVGTSDKTTPVTKWLPGYRYTYRLAITGEITQQLEFSVSLENWETVNDSMKF